MCLELLRYGYQVFVGKVDSLEIDYVAKLRDRVIYVQVCENMDLVETRQRELAPLKAEMDSYPKFVVVNNSRNVGDIDDIECMYAADFVMKLGLKNG